MRKVIQLEANIIGISTCPESYYNYKTKDGFLGWYRDAYGNSKLSFKERKYNIFLLPADLGKLVELDIIQEEQIIKDLLLISVKANR